MRTDTSERAEIADLVQRERAARDAAMWTEMAACWHPQSLVDVSWFKGSGAEFTAASERNTRSSTLSFHQMAPSVVTVRGDRAITDTGCAVHGSRLLGDIEVIVVSHTRLRYRALRTEGEWLLAGLRVAYLCDYLVPRDPGRPPLLDQSALTKFRPAYKYLSYILSQSGHAPRTDLPGADQPESLKQLQAAELAWLAGEA